MTRDEYWNKLVAKNPRIETHKVVMKPENFKSFFEQVWEMSARSCQNSKENDIFPWLNQR